MITEALITGVYTVIETILGLLPSVDMTGNTFLAENVYPAINSLLYIPVIGTLVECAIWLITFEILLFLYHQIVSVLRSVRVLNADPLPD